ncbi:MAG: hypothetical protein LBT39_10480, partial [Treponema sp.]|nr:hypothetical protein [Treponema sp.]
LGYKVIIQGEKMRCPPSKFEKGLQILNFTPYASPFPGSSVPGAGKSPFGIGVFRLILPSRFIGL